MVLFIMASGSRPLCTKCCGEDYEVKVSQAKVISSATTRNLNCVTCEAFCQHPDRSLRLRGSMHFGISLATVAASSFFATSLSTWVARQEVGEPSDQDGVSDLQHITDVSEFAACQADQTRIKLLMKLSDANQYNRLLLKEVTKKDSLLRKCQTDLLSLELELSALVSLAQEIAKDGGKAATRKVNGRYIHSHLAFRLEELQKTLLSEIKDVDLLCSREIQLCWQGMAEDVVVMGSFDSWSHGQSMSPERTGTFTNFSTILMLRPGRYQIKFRVDGKWCLSPQLPTVGEGVTMNNLLIVE